MTSDSPLNPASKMYGVTNVCHVKPHHKAASVFKLIQPQVTVKAIKAKVELISKFSFIVNKPGHS